ncbi:diguanylate cyclase [Dechloromonas sp. ZY10]|uniref:diguanylate cyclase domain-containing protein n=1 Tax=Dechloromonas aquae TaxID=2664436 RepID=UPI003527F85F
MENHGQRWTGALWVLTLSVQVCFVILAYMQDDWERQDQREAQRQLALVVRNLERLGTWGRFSATELRRIDAADVQSELVALSGLQMLQQAGYDYELRLAEPAVRRGGKSWLSSGGALAGDALYADLVVFGGGGQLALWNYARQRESSWHFWVWWGGIFSLGLSVFAWILIDRYLKAMELSAALQLRRQAALFSAMSEAVVVLVEHEGEWLVEEVNPAAEHLFAGSEVVRGSHWRNLFSAQEGSAEKEIASGLATRAGIAEGVGSWRQANAQEDEIWLEYALLPFAAGGVVLVLRNVTERRLREEGLNLYRSVFRGSGEAILVTDRKNRIIEVNPAFCRLTGYAREHVVGLDPRVLASGKTGSDTYREMWSDLQLSGMWQGELWDRHRDGHVYPKWAVITAVHDDFGDVQHYVATFLDISERKAREERVSHQAYHDSLTGLPNRLRFNEYLAEACNAAKRNSEMLTLMFLDLDGFKSVNDRHGHAMGDVLLVEVAARLRACVRETDFVARLGGDEFVIVLPGGKRGAANERVAGKILASLSREYSLSGVRVSSTPSIGIAIYPQAGDTPEALLQQADAAMYRVKHKGKADFWVAAPIAAVEAGQGDFVL